MAEGGFSAKVQIGAKLLCKSAKVRDNASGGGWRPRVAGGGRCEVGLTILGRPNGRTGMLVPTHDGWKRLAFSGWENNEATRAVRGAAATHETAGECLEGLLDLDSGGFGFRAFFGCQLVEGFLDVLLEVLLGDPGETEHEPGGTLDSVCGDSHA